MKVDNCLGCCSLKIGVLIIGILQVIFCSIGTIAITVLLCSGDSHDENNNPPKDQGEEQALPIVFLVSFILQIIISGLLIHGAVKERRGFLLPWLILCAISICCSILSTILLICRANFVSVGGLIVLGITIYMWIVVHSFYKSLRSDGYKDQTAAFVINSEKV